MAKIERKEFNCSCGMRTVVFFTEKYRDMPYKCKKCGDEIKWLK